MCNYPSAAQEQPFTVGLFCITETVKFNLFHHSQWLGALKRKKSGAMGTCPVCPLVKTALLAVNVCNESV